ncbi:MAG TPA: phosphatidylserine decarboxylase family protein [Nitrospiria bacterium]|nr:phosphatidylserine decarboxylase family protein [Nitrospiria bacterium]
MTGRDLLVAKEGLPFIAAGIMLTSISLAVGWRCPALILSLITLFIVWFFRNPRRNTPTSPDIIVAPADGKIIEVKEDFEKRYLNGKAIKISIFMSIFNVHINRIPFPGKVLRVSYNPGRFISANRDKASLENEQNAILMETKEGKRILFIQIAGLIARRIVCWLKVGNNVERGERFGLIRFGSRVDIFLPPDVDLKITKGSKVKGGETVIGVMR